MILDSNIIIYSAMPDNSSIRQFLSERNVYCSDISRLEVLGYHKISADEKVYFQKFFALVFLIPIDDDVIKKAIELRQTSKVSVGDSIIAASAFLLNLPLVTNNEKDFRNIKGIEIINPFNL